MVLEKKRSNKTIVFFIVFIGIVLALLFPTIQDSFIKYRIQNTKEETTVTMTLTKDEIYKLERQQRELADKYEKEYDWLDEEIKEAASKIWFSYDFMYDHSEYDSVKIIYPLTNYTVDGETISFISNEGEITQVHSEKGWEDK